MKIAILIGLTALISTVLSVPTSPQDDVDATPNEDEYVNEIKKLFTDHGQVNRMTLTDELNTAAIEEAYSKGKASSETDGYSSETFPNEVKDYFEKTLDVAQTMQESEGMIVSGDTVALQTFVRDHWFSCVGENCGRSNCPRQLFEGSDWDNCWGEVFQIFRAYGPGSVKSGDLVGLYYPREGLWVGCPGERCYKANCPGHPNSQFGFQDLIRWFRCSGEVFIIYAKDKPKNAVITSNDDIALYYFHDRHWLAQAFDLAYKHPCLGGDNNHDYDPPPRSNYDPCPAETFTIWKKVVEE